MAIVGNFIPTPCLLLFLVCSRVGEEVLRKFVLELQKLHGVGMLQNFSGVGVFG